MEAMMTKPGSKVLWYMQIEGTEFGPFSTAEVESLIASRKLKGAIYVWRAGMTNFIPASACSDFSHLAIYLGGETAVKRHAAVKKKKLLATNKRKGTDRRSLIATISVMTSPRTGFLIGVCEDISMTGMQIILDSTNEVEVGAELTLKVDPLGLTQVPAFQIRGKVVWVEAREMRMGFTFAELTSVAERSLSAYLKSAKDRELANDSMLIEVG